MAGIYIHIPFCKQACHYCDFHFSTSLKLKAPLLAALELEIVSRKNELEGQMVETIYFGGGTPSILEVDEIKHLLELIYKNYMVAALVEITLEANPDDLTIQKLKALKGTEINRFSIGVQSFFAEDLRYMNRIHTASEAEAAIKASQDSGFENITIDLIYGTPTLTNSNWEMNLRKSISFGVPHLSCYALTVEDKTPLAALIHRKKLALVDEEKVADHFTLMVEILNREAFEQYEISNFAKSGFRSKHNSSYWSGKSYLGSGPGAHSYNGQDIRRWNISNNALYIKNINNGEAYFEDEKLIEKDRFNEFIMTQIRLIEGISLPQVALKFGTLYRDHILSTIDHWNHTTFIYNNDTLCLTSLGKVISDKLAADLFVVESL